MGVLSEEERSAKNFEVFIVDKTVSYPRRPDGDIAAAIASQLQGRDFELLRCGDAIFEDMDSGELTLWEGPDCWPIFINEAAYLENNLAFCMTQKHEIRIPQLKLDGSHGEIELPLSQGCDAS